MAKYCEKCHGTGTRQTKVDDRTYFGCPCATCGGTGFVPEKTQIAPTGEKE